MQNVSDPSDRRAFKHRVLRDYDVTVGFYWIYGGPISINNKVPVPSESFAGMSDEVQIIARAACPQRLTIECKYADTGVTAHITYIAERRGEI